MLDPSLSRRDLLKIGARSALLAMVGCGDRALGSDRRIVRAAIHPAIGIARVGNSANAWYLAPQVPDPPPQPVGFYRDDFGALKREAVQFRVYGYNAAGEVVRELTADDAQIEWTVHVANRKAQWYQWQIAMDIPEAAKTVLPLRNATVTDRASLAIDAGPHTVCGRDVPPVELAGAFTGVPVKLGDIATDAAGRLVFLGGHGVSASPTNAPIFKEDDDNSFINADDWYDDTCDGPVDATVRIGDRAIPVDGAWVASAPPNYAPQVKAERTLYDLLFDLYAQAGWLAAPATPSFAQDIYPVLQRLSGLQWVNAGFATAFGHNGRYDFEDAAFVARLAAAPPPGGAYDPNAELRRQVFNAYRPPNPPDGNQLPWPWLYGDAMTIPAGQSPRQNASVAQTQYDVLSQWANGHFVADHGTQPAPACIDDVPLAQQPATLDRAALEFCLADAFHPGCETTWPMRHLSMYTSPFRLRRRPAGVPERDYGPTLDQQQTLALTGPLHGQSPGDITRWMGLPWQADTAYCRAGYDTSYDPFAPTFWPARVPNHVLTASDYAIVVDPAQPPQRRIDAFGNRTDWTKPLHGTTAQQMEQMVRIFGSMGLVEVRPGVTGDPAFPAVMMVASYGPDVPPADAGSVAEPVAAKGVAAPATADAKRRAHGLPRGTNFESVDEGRRAP
ncbi:MAG TPA: LodA/GoxA family CTQ-dependent oxidase, partial [Tahibacter sp.]|nr:LodA/GoxA family CTQ-dependent oxidase [Tahibacter sp.]